MDEKERLEIFKELGLQEKLADLKKDLQEFHVDFDNWFSERSLYPDQVNEALKVLKDEDNMYEKDGALWLRTTKNGDDKDRVVIRTNGVPTYFCSDIAYVGNKIRRGYNKLIDIWGADHHGYIIRLKTAMKFLGYNPDDFEIMLLQMVTLLRDGQPVKMSKRTGQAVSLRELMEEVGTDAARYFFCARTLDSQMDFDIDLAKKQSSDNPVYYIQYANARIHSLFRQAKEAKVTWDPQFTGVDFTCLKEECEMDLIKKMENYHQLIDGAAKERAPQRIAKYAYELAALFHHFYRECRILGVDSEVTQARLGLITAVQYVLVHALTILGITAPEKCDKKGSRFILWAALPQICILQRSCHHTPEPINPNPSTIFRKSTTEDFHICVFPSTLSQRRSHDKIHLRNRRRRFIPGQRHHRCIPGQTAEEQRLQSHHSEI